MRVTSSPNPSHVYRDLDIPTAFERHILFINFLPKLSPQPAFSHKGQTYKYFVRNLAQAKKLFRQHNSIDKVHIRLDSCPHSRAAWKKEKRRLGQLFIGARVVIQSKRAKIDRYLGLDSFGHTPKSLRSALRAFLKRFVRSFSHWSRSDDLEGFLFYKPN